MVPGDPSEESPPLRQRSRLLSGHSSLLTVAGSGAGTIDEVLRGQRGLEKNSRVNGTEGSVIPSGI